MRPPPSSPARLGNQLFYVDPILTTFTMLIKELRLAFIQVESIVGPLAALKSPEIPCPYLLNEGLYQKALEDVLAAPDARRLPWADKVGKRFWFYYLERTRLKARVAKQLWRQLVPFTTTIGGIAVSGARIPGDVEPFVYLYPWGIGLGVEVHVKGSWSLDEAVTLAVKIRQTNIFDWTAGGSTVPVTLDGLMDRATAAARTSTFGPAVPSGRKSDIFSIVTVIDAEGVDPTVAVENKQEVHRALEAWTGWSSLWKVVALKELSASALDIMRNESPAGHVLYSSRRGRAVWFPAKFLSVPPARAESLTLYHQNLFVSSLQTESLCGLATVAAGQFAAGQTLGDFAVTYKNCIVLAAGILARLWGNPTFYDSYRSDSVRAQIKASYLEAVNAIRKATKPPMSPLN